MKKLTYALKTFLEKEDIVQFVNVSIRIKKGVMECCLSVF